MGIINSGTIRAAEEIADIVAPKLVEEAALTVEKPLAATVLHGVETKVGAMTTDAVTHGLLSKGGAAPVANLGYVANNLGHTPAPRIFADVQGTVLKVKGPFPGHNGLMHEIMRVRVEGVPALAQTAAEGTVSPGVTNAVSSGVQGALLPQAGQEIEIANDITVGSMVPKDVVGQKIAIRGVVYQDGSKIGMHWTHSAKHGLPGGWIKTLLDGHVYQ